MTSVLQQLENNQAVLLMYLADELPAADRAEVDRMLAVDAGLRDELEQLREAYDSFFSEMAREDGAIRLAVPESVAVRRVGRAMRQWNARRLAAAAVQEPAGRGLRYPWWAYPLAAAASVVIAFLVWWGNTDRAPLAQHNTGNSFRSAEEYAAAPDASAVADSRGELIARSLGFGDYALDMPGTGGGSEWDDAGSLYAAVDPSDANVLMLLNTDNNAAEESDAAPDDDPS